MDKWKRFRGAGSLLGAAFFLCGCQDERRSEPLILGDAGHRSDAGIHGGTPGTTLLGDGGADGGSSGGGGGAPGAPTGKCAFDPNKVHVLINGGARGTGVAKINDPKDLDELEDLDNACWGFQRFAPVILRPTDGRVVYVDRVDRPPTTLVREFHEDKLKQDEFGQLSLPDSYLADDSVLFTGTDTLTPSDIVAIPGSSDFLMGFSQNDPPPYYADRQGTSVLKTYGRVLAVGANGIMLADFASQNDLDYQIVQPDGTRVKVQGADLDYPIAVRSHGDGFWVVLGEAAAPSRWYVAPDGTATLELFYPPTEYAVTSLGRGALDVEGTLYQAVDTGSSGSQQLWRRKPEPAAKEVLVDLANFPFVLSGIVTITGP
ncbi:MAG: hypothetical protein QM778_28145 [Myxococcales bacterium]